MDGPSAPRLRWRLADDDRGQAPLFDAVERVPGRRELAGLEFLHVRARRIVNRLPADSRMPFRFTINPYRGCSHACVYCFARPTHEYLNLDRAGDFDTKIVVKINAVECAEAELSAPGWHRETVALGTNTDPYQPCEGRYRLTRGIVQSLHRNRTPFGIVTKSPLVERDMDVLTAASRDVAVHVDVSIGSLDRDIARELEPSAAAPARRLEIVRALTDAGVSAGVLVAPIVPGISDRREQLEPLVRAAIDAGARTVGAVPLHLRPGVREHYLSWLGAHRPDLLTGYLARYRGAYLEAGERREITRFVQEIAADQRRRTGRHDRPARPGFRFGRSMREPARDDPQLTLLE